MKKALACIMTILLFLCLAPVQAEEEPSVLNIQESTLLDEGWKFSLSDGENYASLSLNDSTWTDVDLPHDWSIEQAWTTEGEGESGFLPGGTGWYRKTFTVDPSLKGKTVLIHFDGIYQNAVVYVNGQQTASHPYGYTGFTVDLSSRLIMNGKTANVIAVKVQNLIPSSRWYSGSGIYRDVHLYVLDPLHIAEDGVVITTPDLEAQKDGTVSSRCLVSLINDGERKQNAEVVSWINDENGDQVSEPVHTKIEIEAGGAAEAEQFVNVGQPELWSTDHPVLYTLHTEIQKENKITDSRDIPFGYRYFSFDKDEGFFLNGQHTELKGVCLHHDQGALGAAAYSDAFERQLDKLRAIGVNAIRFAHNPTDPKMLSLCAEKGFLVVEEAFDTWALAKNYNMNDYSAWFNVPVGKGNALMHAEPDMTWAQYDIREMVRKARNNPSVILWSIGNEILGNIGGDTSMYPAYADELCTWVQMEDTTRPCTIADNMAQKDNEVQDAMDEAVVNHGGIIGLNYVIGEDYDKVREKHPDWIFYGSETASTLTTRGEYSTFEKNEKNYQLSAYGTQHVDWGSTAQQAWSDVISRPWLAGEFVWTGFDYIGEPEPWNGLSQGSVTNGDPIPHSSYFGMLDTAGFEKDLYYYYAAQWKTDGTVLHILPVWDKKGVKRSFLNFTKVYVYSSAPYAELFLNGKSKGRKQTEGGIAEWLVWYRPGTISAKAYDDNGSELTPVMGRSSITTSADPAGFAVSLNRETMPADGRSLCYVTVDIVDRDGNFVNAADSSFTFTVEGEGKIAGMDNGDPTNLTPLSSVDGITGFQEAFHGKVLVILKAGKTPGALKLNINGGNLGTKEITIPVE